MAATRRKRIVEYFIVVSIVGGLFALLYPAVKSARERPGRFSPGPSGELIPVAAPQEANRIVHASGLSIIVPENWEQIRDHGPDVPFLWVAARVQGFRRLTAWITIEKQEHLSEAILSGTARVTFQGYPAYERMEVEREDTFDDPASSRYSLYVDVAGEWWLIEFVVADEIRTLPHQIKAYIDSIILPAVAKQQSNEPETDKVDSLR